MDETNIAFGLGAELNRGPLPVPDGSAPIALSGGVMKVGPISIPGRSGDGALSADFDLRKLAGGTRLTLTSSASNLKFWSGPPPSAMVAVDNVLDAPRRQLDVSSLSAALAAQAIARETDRIATMEADIRERAFFNRRLKGERFMDRRRQEIEDFKVEQSRLKGLSEHLRAMEDAEKAAELEAAKKAEEAAAAKAAAEKAAAEKAAAEKAAADKAAADKAAAEKAAADKAAADSAGSGQGRNTRRRRGDSRQGSVRVRAGAEERRTGRRGACGADAPGEAEGALDAGRTGPRRALLIGMGVALGLEHENPNGR